MFLTEKNESFKIEKHEFYNILIFKLSLNFVFTFGIIKTFEKS